MEVLHESGRCKEAHDHADLLSKRRPEWGVAMHNSIAWFCDGAIADALSWNLKLDFTGGGWAFGLVGEYAEAYRKANDHARPFLLVMEGRIEEGIELVDRRVRLDPKTYGSNVDTGDLYYFARSFNKASEIYERALEGGPAGLTISGNMPVIKTMRLAYIRRISGDEAGAQELAAIAREEQAQQYAAGKRNGDIYLSAGMIAAFDNEPQRAIAALRTGIRDSSLRLYLFFNEAIFDAIRSEPGFIEARKELDAILAVEHEKILQLICFNNPSPNEWRPLPETCEGVVEKPELQAGKAD
jgi:tetratricopeptide (TPR) repeat protein